MHAQKKAGKVQHGGCRGLDRERQQTSEACCKQPSSVNSFCFLPAKDIFARLVLRANMKEKEVQFVLAPKSLKNHAMKFLGHACMCKDQNKDKDKDNQEDKEHNPHCFCWLRTC